MSGQQTTRPEALRRALPILIVTVIGAVVIGLLAMRSVRILESTGPGSQDFTLLAPVCAGEGQPAAAVFDRQTSSHPAVFARAANGEWQIDREAVPAEFRPETIGEVQLVLCISPAEEVAFPQCASGETIKIEQVDIRLVSARTGATIDEDVVLPAGAEGDCLPAGEPAMVTDGDLWDWVRPYVAAG